MAKIATKQADAEHGRVTFDFEDGNGTVIADVSTLPENVVKHLVVYGLSQKLGDAYSGEKDPATARKIVEAKLDQFANGEIRATSGAGTSGPRVSQLAEALSRVTGREVDVCVTKVASMDDDEKKDLRKHPKVRLALEAIKEEKAQAKRKELEAAAGDAADLDF